MDGGCLHSAPPSRPPEVLTAPERLPPVPMLPQPQQRAAFAGSHAQGMHRWPELPSQASLHLLFTVQPGQARPGNEASGGHVS